MIHWIKNKIRSHVPRHQRVAIRNLLFEFRNAVIAVRGKRLLKHLAGEKELKIHLGCGGETKPGWVNIDLEVDTSTPASRDTKAIAYDLRNGLCLENGSAAYIYSSHFFEHLNSEEGLRLMSDCYRVLRPGGIFRIVLPNQRGFFEAYLQGNREFFSVLKTDIDLEFPYLADYINWDVYQCTHQCIYDEDKLGQILRNIGFAKVEPAHFLPSVDSDSRLRRQYSYYVEATK